MGYAHVKALAQEENLQPVAVGLFGIGGWGGNCPGYRVKGGFVPVTDLLSRGRGNVLRKEPWHILPVTLGTYSRLIDRKSVV